MTRLIGNIIEQYAIDTFRLEKTTYNNYHDAWLMNMPVEIKGVCKHHNCDRNPNGRAWITNPNHKELVKANGMYLFIVYKLKEGIYDIGKYTTLKDYDDIEICYTIFIAAHRIKINGGKNTKISYKNLLKMM